MSDPSLSDIDFKNKMALVWTTLNRTKAGCVFLMVVVSLLPHLEIGRNDHRECAPHFSFSVYSPKSVRVLIKLWISIEISAVSTILGERWMCRMIRPLMYMLTVLAIVGRLWYIIACHVSRLQMTLSRWTLSRISTKGTVLKIQCLVILHIWKNWRVISIWKKLKISQNSSNL